MRISTVRVFRDDATGLLKRQLFEQLTAEIARQIGKSGASEEEILSDFESWRKTRRDTRRRL